MRPQHKRRLARPRVRPAEPPYVVFCVDSPHDTGVYDWFTHEATAVLYAAGWAIARGEMTDAEAYAAWVPYRHFWPELYWDRESREGGSRYGMPHIDDLLDRECLPGFYEFTQDADSLPIPGFSSFEGFKVFGDDALEALRVGLRGRYHIAVVSDDEWEAWQRSVPAAREVIARARATLV